MTRAAFVLADDGLERLAATMAECGSTSAETVSGVLDSYAAPLVRGSIQRLLPSSGRSWSGKRAAASAVDPFASRIEHDGAPALVTASRSGYHYLYFPDDGSSTRRHAGMQDFMGRGQDAVADKIIDRCLAALADKLRS